MFYLLDMDIFWPRALRFASGVLCWPPGAVWRTRLSWMDVDGGVLLAVIVGLGCVGMFVNVSPIVFIRKKKVLRELKDWEL